MRERTQRETRETSPRETIQKETRRQSLSSSRKNRRRKLGRQFQWEKQLNQWLLERHFRQARKESQFR